MVTLTSPLKIDLWKLYVQLTSSFVCHEGRHNGFPKNSVFSSVIAVMHGSL